MSSNYAGVDSFSANLDLITDDDEPHAAPLRLPCERLLDNDVHVRNRAIALETRATALEALAVQATDTSAGLIEIATQAEQETGTDVTRAVTPGRQHFHPSAAKFWAHVEVSGGVPAISVSYNVTSVTDGGVGILTVTIATDFSSTNWACLATIESGPVVICRVTARGTSSVTVTCVSLAPAATDPAAWNVIGFGDQ